MVYVVNSPMYYLEIENVDFNKLLDKKYIQK